MADRSEQRGQRAIKGGVYTENGAFDFTLRASDNRKILEAIGGVFEWPKFAFRTGSPSRMR